MNTEECTKACGAQQAERPLYAGLNADGTYNAQQAIGLIKQQDRDPTIQVIANVRANRSFEDALAHCKYGGKKIARAGWNGKGMWVAAQHPDKNSKMSAPYLYLRTAHEFQVPWLPSQSDIFANDWAILPD